MRYAWIREENYRVHHHSAEQITFCQAEANLVRTGEPSDLASREFGNEQETEARIAAQIHVPSVAIPRR